MPTLPMGLGYVAESARAAGHTVFFLDLMASQQPLEVLEARIDAFSPDVIGISIRNIDDQSRQSPRFLLEETLQVVSRCKSRCRAPVVLGGAGYSIFPQAALEYLGADLGIQGEGEISFVRLLERLAAGQSLEDVPGLYRRGAKSGAARVFERNLDRLPLCDPNLFDARLSRNPSYFLPIQTRRGCPLRCSYCSTSHIEGSLIRKRSPDRVIKELARWRRAGFRRVFFVDNTFNLPVSYARRLCDQMVADRLDLSWRCILYPGRITVDLVTAMARAGCREVSLGFESGSQEMLDRMHKRFTTDDIRRAVRMLADAGIAGMGFLLLGGPGETHQSVMESLTFADTLNLDAVKITAGIRIYPHTDLARIAVRQGCVRPDDDLLQPRFYLRDNLDGWLQETITAWSEERPHWIV